MRRYLFVSILVSVAMIWAPIGFGALPQIEEWEFYGIFQQDGPTFWVTGPAFIAHVVRPLFLFPYALAYALTLSPLALHALLALALIVKGLGMAGIAWWLTRDRMITLIGAILFIVYPADTMQMGLRGVGIVWSSALAAAAIAMILFAADRRSLLLAILAGVTILIAGLSYESALMMGAAPLILWFARFGLARGYREISTQWPIVLIWVIALLANAAYIAAVWRPSGYQGAILAGGQGFRNAVWYLVMTGLPRTLFQCWSDALEMLWRNVRYVPYLAVGLVAIGLAYRRIDAPAPAGSIRQGLSIAAAGVVIAALGYAPFLLSGSHVLITQRTYLFAAIGGSIFVIGLWHLVNWRRPQVIAVSGVVLVAAGFGSQWEQLAHYTELSNRQRMYLSGILSAAPDVSSHPEKTLVITDHTGSLGNTWMLRGEILSLALSYLVGAPVKAVVCEAPSGIFSSFIFNEYGEPGHCHSSESGWSIGEDRPGGRKLPMDQVTLISIDQDGHATRVDGESKQPAPKDLARWRAVLGCMPCTYEPRFPAGPSYRFDFGRWWSLEDVAWGDGWRDAEWQPLPARPRSTAWMIEPESTLLFKLVPEQVSYRLALRLGASISQRARDTLTMALNGKRLTYDWISSDTIASTVDPELLRRGTNELRLAAVSGTPYGISNSVDWVELAPAKP